MQTNSPANNAPANRPLASVPSLSNNVTPRSRHHSISSTTAPAMRMLACHSGGTSTDAVLIRICCKPQNAQHATRRATARGSR